MKNFKLTNLLILFLSAPILLTSTNQAQANMFNKFKKGFYFEKYKTAEEATNALLELHPIGSDVEGLIKTLEGAGAMIKEEDLKNYKKFKEYDRWWKEGITKFYVISYDKASPFFVIINYLEWRGGIAIDKNNKIIFCGLHRGRSY